MVWYRTAEGKTVFMVKDRGDVKLVSIGRGTFWYPSEWLTPIQ